MIQLITFDFWATLYIPRDEAQLDAVRQARFAAIRDVLTEAGFPVSVEAVRSAWERLTENGVRETSISTPALVDSLCERLSIDPAPLLRQRLVRTIHDVASRVQWRRAPGIGGVLRHLRQQGYRLAVVSNTGFPAGQVLRQVLAADGMLLYFEAFAFSDELGVRKPDPEIFRPVLQRVGVDPAEAVHIGDRPAVDVAGAHAAGMRAIRYAGLHDDPGPPEAEAVIHDFRELPEVLAGWK